MVFVNLEQFSLYDAFTATVFAFVLYKLVLALIDLLNDFRHGPPGPVGLPIVGYYPFVRGDVLPNVLKIGEKYKKIFQINLLGEKFYFLNDMEAVRVLAVKGALITGRPSDKFTTLNAAFTNQNITSADGDWWKKHQKFILENLSRQGVGKVEFEDKVHDACNRLLTQISNTGGKRHDFYELLTNCTSNIVSRLLFNVDYDNEDPLSITLRQHVQEFFSCLPSNAFQVGSMFKIIYYLSGDRYGRLNNLPKKIVAFWKPIVDERLKMTDQYTAVDLLDEYVCAHKAEKEATGASKYFSIDKIVLNLFAMVVGGTETTASTLYHGINLMVLHPDVQRKVQQEIDEKIGKRRICMADRKILNYTTAVVSEVQRYVCLLPLSFIRRNYEEIEVVGYKLPAKSNIVINLWKLSRDSTYFKNPHEFDPRNFLDEKGCYIKREASMPYSYGKRMCVAYSVAEISVFICFASLMQKFRWKQPPNEEVRREVQEGFVRILHRYSASAHEIE